MPNTRDLTPEPGPRRINSAPTPTSAVSKDGMMMKLDKDLPSIPEPLVIKVPVSVAGGAGGGGGGGGGAVGGGASLPAATTTIPHPINDHIPSSLAAEAPPVLSPTHAATFHSTASGPVLQPGEPGTGDAALVGGGVGVGVGVGEPEITMALEERLAQLELDIEAQNQDAQRWYSIATQYEADARTYYDKWQSASNALKKNRPMGVSALPLDSTPDDKIVKDWLQIRYLVRAFARRYFTPPRNVLTALPRSPDAFKFLTSDAKGYLKSRVLRPVLIQSFLLSWLLTHRSNASTYWAAEAAESFRSMCGALIPVPSLHMVQQAVASGSVDGESIRSFMTWRAATAALLGDRRRGVGSHTTTTTTAAAAAAAGATSTTTTATTGADGNGSSSSSSNNNKFADVVEENIGLKTTALMQDIAFFATAKEDFKSITQDLREIVSKVVDFQEMLHRSRAIFTTDRWYIKVEGRDVPYGFKVVEDAESEDGFEEARREHTVELVVCPALCKIGSSDGTSYETRTVLSKGTVVCKETRQTMEKLIK